MPKNKKILIIGAGSWGTTLAIIWAKNNKQVSLHSVFSEENKLMQKARENKFFLPGKKFPANLQILEPITDLANFDIVVLAVPVQYLRNQLKVIKEKIGKISSVVPIVSVAKGIEIDSLNTPSQIIAQEWKISKIAALSGPTIAREVIAGLPTAAVIAAKNIKLAEQLQYALTASNLRLYAHNDILGVELAGALKNVIAIACGIIDGMQLGTNAKSSLVTRAIKEISRLGVKLGASGLTFAGISGVGDLITTCFSPYSRNRCVGEALGKGEKLSSILKNMKMVAEGVTTVKSAYKLGKFYKLDLPITEQVYNILYRNKSPHKAVQDLLKRPLKKEFS